MAINPLIQATPADSVPGPVSDWLAAHPIITQVCGFGLVMLAAYFADRISKRLLVAMLSRIVRGTAFTWDDKLLQHNVFGRLAHIAPALTIYYGIQAIPGVSDPVTGLVMQSAAAAIVLIAVFTIGAALSAANDIYSSSALADGRPIKGYVQVGKIVLYLLGAIMAVATLTGRSPLILLSGIGAMTAVLLIVFRDTILSFVASLQIASYDLMRVGDWIEMPQYNADGDVVDIGLHTIKVQNWDKTITTIPTHKFLSDSFKNWRSMSESGGRRIKRAIYIDMNSIRFLEDADVARFESFVLLRDYVRQKTREIADYNNAVGSGPGVIANARRLTNIGTFRAYVVRYLRQHPSIHQGMTLMVRQLDPTPNGLPIQIYAFANDVNWIAYEGIQSDIFDHIMAIVPEFGLRLFQTPSGRDFEAALAARQGVRTEA